jgi:hypothetical protein
MKTINIIETFAHQNNMKPTDNSSLKEVKLANSKLQLASSKWHVPSGIPYVFLFYDKEQIIERAGVDV